MNLTPVIRHRYFDANGNPLAGGKLYTYAAGTTTPQATYTDQAGGTPNANPIILDANGEAAVWADPTLSYKYVLKDSSEVTQWTVDNVIGILTADAVPTAALQDLSVTRPKIALDAVGADQLADSMATDGDRAVTTNHVRNRAITPVKLGAGLATKTTTATLTTDEGAISADASGGAFTITLPAASGASGHVFRIQKTDSSLNAVTLDGNASETIRGQATFKLSTQYETVTIISDGSNWLILSHTYPQAPVAYTPTFTGFGTVSGVNIRSWRVGSHLHVEGNFTSGTPTATEARMTLGYNGTSANVTSVSGLPTTQVAGPLFYSNAAVAEVDLASLIESSVTYVTFGYRNSGTSIFSKVNGSDISAASRVFGVKFAVQIAGWEG